MSRWAERLKSKYGHAEIAEIAETPPEGPQGSSFGNSDKFGIGVSVEIASCEVGRFIEAARRAVPQPDQDPAEWQG